MINCSRFIRLLIELFIDRSVFNYINHSQLQHINKIIYKVTKLDSLVLQGIGLVVGTDYLTVVEIIFN